MKRIEQVIRQWVKKARVDFTHPQSQSQRPRSLPRGGQWPDLGDRFIVTRHHDRLTPLDLIQIVHQVVPDQADIDVNHENHHSPEDRAHCASSTLGNYTTSLSFHPSRLWSRPMGNTMSVIFACLLREG